MGKRHEAIGIKQAIRYEWMQKTTNLMLAGMTAADVRAGLHDYLEDRLGSGSRGSRSPEARSFAVSILMNIWVTPDPVLTGLRDSALVQVRSQGSDELAAHWAMICAAYPFWYNVARQTGRLLALQDQITMKQVSARSIEQYGDRQTVSRNVRFVVRSYEGWQLLQESDKAGYYKQVDKQPVQNPATVCILLESALHALPEGKETLSVLLSSPAFFPFTLPVISGASLSQGSDRLDVVRYGLDAELLTLR